MPIRKLSALVSPLLVTFSLLLTSCTTTMNHSVGVKMVLPQGATVEHVRDDQVFLMLSAITEPMPVYPVEIVKRREGTVLVCVEAIVDDGGEVSAVELAQLLPGCLSYLDERAALYFNAVKDALERWTFLAAAICTFPEHTPTNPECLGTGVRIEPVAVRLPLVFSFKVASGKATASGGKA